MRTPTLHTSTRIHKHFLYEVGSIAQWLAYLLPDPAAPGLILRQKKLSMLQWHCLEESGHWLENVDQTHLVVSEYYKRSSSSELHTALVPWLGH